VHELNGRLAASSLAVAQLHRHELDKLLNLMAQRIFHYIDEQYATTLISHVIRGRDDGKVSQSLHQIVQGATVHLSTDKSFQQGKYHGLAATFTLLQLLFDVKQKLLDLLLVEFVILAFAQQGLPLP